MKKKRIVELCREAEEIVRKWYVENFKWKIPEVQYVILPKEVSDTSVFLLKRGRTDLKYVKNQLRRAKKKVERRYERYFNGSKMQRLYKSFERAEVKFTQHNSPSKIIQSYSQHISINPIFISLDFEIDEDEPIRMLIHEFFHLLQYSTGLAQQHPLSLESTAYYISEKCWGNEKNSVVMDSLLSQSLNHAKSVNDILMDILHLDKITKMFNRKSVEEKCRALMSKDFYNVMEEDVFYKYYREHIRDFLGQKTLISELERIIKQ